MVNVAAGIEKLDISRITKIGIFLMLRRSACWVHPPANPQHWV